jgi:hypothetical protein
MNKVDVVENMATFLIEKCGFKPEEIHKIAEQKQRDTKVSGRLRKSAMR